MSASARRPGVLLSVRWGEQDLARDFFRLDVPRTFTIGSAPDCDFPCGGARALRLLQIDEGEAWLRQANGKPMALERGASAYFVLGPLSFQAQLLEAPPQLGSAAIAELTTVNLSLLLMAAFGLFAVAAANSDAEGRELDDGLSAAPARAVMTLVNHPPVRPARASASAAPNQDKVKPTHQARKSLPVRQVGRAGSAKFDLGSLFEGPGAGSVFGDNTLGPQLLAASTGLRTAQAGNTPGELEGGGGHGLDGNGLGGMNLEGIGTLGTRGRAGGHTLYGTQRLLPAGEKIPPPGFDEPIVEGCAADGSGCLDKELIRKVIRQNLSGFRYCYESLLNRFPNLEGKVSVRFSIAQAGNVPSASVAGSTAHNSELESCVAQRTRLLQFPLRKWSGPVAVSYPFIFKQSGK